MDINWLTQPGAGGLVVITVLMLCLGFYGSLILWIARAPKDDSGRGEER